MSNSLSITERQGIIQYLPIGDKPSEIIKHYEDQLLF